MASHLTLSVAGSTGSTIKSFGAPADGDGAPTSLMDAFAALLDGTTPAGAPSATAQMEGNWSLAGLGRLAFGLGGEAEEPSEALDPSAAGLDAAMIQPLPLAPNQADLAPLLDSLTNIAASIQAGQPPTEQDLDAASAALARLAQTLGIALDGAAGPTTASPPVPGSFAEQLATALSPLAQALLAGQQTASASAQELGHKLAALLDGLNQDSAALDQLAAANASAATIDASLSKLGRSGLKLTQSELQSSATAALAMATEQALDAAPAVEVDPGRSGDEPDTLTSDLKAQAAAVSAKADLAAGPVGGPNQSAATNRAELTPAALRPAQPGYQTSQQQLNLPQLAFELVHQANQGNSRFQIRLDPPELGRIEVDLDFDAAGQVTARLTVEKSETLDLMQRDQRGLERALQQAGLDSGKTNLEFSLRQNPFPADGQGPGNQNGQGRERNPGGTAGNSDAEPAPLPNINLYRGSLAGGGINIIA
ncbi:MAG: hypothetical protein JWR39_2108 [Devosia sp.]|nr:hypothetical protein [Devosia sp.]